MSNKALVSSVRLCMGLMVSTLLFISNGVGAQIVSASPAAKPDATQEALDKALSGLQVEKIVAQLLASIDPKAIAEVAEQAAQDIAAGKEPQIVPSKAMQDMQNTVQKQFSVLAPALVRSLASLLAPMLSQLKLDMADSLKAE